MINEDPDRADSFPQLGSGGVRMDRELARWLGWGQLAIWGRFNSSHGSSYNRTVHTRLGARGATLRTLAIWLLFFVGIAVGQPDVGLRLKSAQVPKGIMNECPATPSQTYPCVQDLTLNGVRFSVVGYAPQTLRIKYLLTFDKHFISKDGLRVGSLVEIAEDKLLSIRGWHIYGPKTKDGWHIIVGSSLTEGKVQAADGSRVDPSRPVAGRVHRFEVVGLEKGGI